MICEIIGASLSSDLLLSVQSACSQLGVGRSSYYNWKSRMASDVTLNLEEMKLKNEIQQIAVEFPRYGYRRMTEELHRRKYSANSKRVRRLMKEDNLLCIRNTFRPITTNSNHSHRVYPNLARDMTVNEINQLWVSDITYIQLLNEFIYLAVIMDVFSKRCVGWELSRSIDTTLALNALHKALELRADMDHTGLVHHSDQGVQYASNDYVDCLKRHGITISMSRKGNPYDNAFAESFIKTLKYEEVYLSEYRTFGEAYENIQQFIEIVYNQKRLHSSIGYRPPMEFEEAQALRTIA